MSVPEKIRKALRGLPDKPGCYIMRDRNGRIIYVGKARSLRKRVQTYFRQATLRSADPKLRSLIKSAADLEFFVARNEAEAILTEGRLIKEYRPRYNVAFRDDKRFLLIRIDKTEIWPRLKLVRIRHRDSATYFGPYASSLATRSTVDFLEKQFGLRKCAPVEPNADTYRHCINDVVRFCSAPCVQKVTHEEYMQRVNDTCAFLRGEKPELLKGLRAEMETAAEALNFEKAAAIRDTLFMLDRTIRQNARMTRSPEQQGEAALAGIKELQKQLALPRIPHVIEGFDVSNISGTYSVASMVCAVDGMPQRKRYRRFRITGVEGIDDPRMIAEAVRRRYSRLLEEGTKLPDLVMVDGGITQLRAARRELEALGLADLPSVGLAKQYEEIYNTDPGKPIRLKAESDALKVLQRLRDEAHRFAITYHRRLRSKRIRESALDEIPGIGPNRKQQLLQHFGSVHKLARASVEDITTVPGIGSEMARIIHKQLTRQE
jgi:excinuclease ABC subunit C